jgi:hypothetical protein
MFRICVWETSRPSKHKYSTLYEQNSIQIRRKCNYLDGYLFTYVFIYSLFKDMSVAHII